MPPMFLVKRNLEDKNQIYYVEERNDSNYNNVLTECYDEEMAKRIARLLNISEHGFTIISNRRS